MSEELYSAVAAELSATKESLYARGFGQRLGFGAKSAILVVDFIRAFTDPRAPGAANLDREVEATRVLLDRARERHVPIIFSNTWLVRGTEWVEVDERLGRSAGDQLLPKKYASCFFGTDLASRLVSRGVDTLVVTGCSTSGCIRATVVDACSLGFRPIVVQEAVGDRAPLSHLTSLFDILNSSLKPRLSGVPQSISPWALVPHAEHL
jgi:maleamate amidohydrolase